MEGEGLGEDEGERSEARAGGGEREERGEREWLGIEAEGCQVGTG